MRKVCALLLLAFYVSSVNYAQTVSGIVTDQKTFEKLIGVNIITEDGKGTATDIFGKYSLQLDEGTHQITFRYIGYKDVVKEIILKNGERKTIDIKLFAASEQLSTVVVSAGKFEQKLEEITISMEVLKPSLIENKNTTNIQTKLGWNYFHLGQYNQAISIFNQELRNNSSWSSIYEGLGWSYLNLKKLTQSRASFLKAIKLQPLNNSAHIGLNQSKKIAVKEKLKAKEKTINRTLF